MTDIFHLAERRHWEDARATGSYGWSTRGKTVTEVGFAHCSYAEQVAAVAAYLYPDATDLVLLRIDPAKVPEVRVEGGYPHVYGPIPVEAVTEVTPYP